MCLPEHSIMEPTLIFETRRDCRPQPTTRFASAARSGMMAEQVEEIAERFQRIIHFVGDSCRQPPRSCEFLRVQECFLAQLLPGDVSKHKNYANDTAARVANRRGAILDRYLRAVGPQQHGVVRRTRHAPVLQHLAHRALHRLPTTFVDDFEDRLQRKPGGGGKLPPRCVLSDGIHQGDSASRIRCNHRIANAPQGDGELRSFFIQVLLQFSEPANQRRDEAIGKRKDSDSDAILRRHRPQRPVRRSGKNVDGHALGYGRQARRGSSNDAGNHHGCRKDGEKQDKGGARDRRGNQKCKHGK